MQGLPYTSISTPAAWRGLLARAALLRACATRIAQLYDLSFAYESIDGTIKDLAKAAAVAQSAVSDEAAVADAIRRWDAAVRDWLELPTTAARDECSLLHDVLELSASAKATDPFDALFQAISDLGSDVYGDQWPTPTLKLNDLHAHPRDPPDPYAITAKTSLTTAKTSLTEPPMVTLLVYPNGLGPATFAAIPCLLAHECICHVPAKQDRVKNNSAFAEGFMDWAASYFFQSAVAHLLPDLSGAARAHSGPFGDLFARPTTKEGRTRRFGHLAANNLVTFTIDELHVSDLEALAIVARVARDLNCVPAAVDVKDLLVAGIAALPRPTDALSAQVMLGVLKGSRPAADLL
jgi:hypothetical protein